VLSPIYPLGYDGYSNIAHHNASECHLPIKIGRLRQSERLRHILCHPSHLFARLLTKPERVHVMVADHKRYPRFDSGIASLWTISSCKQMEDSHRPLRP
jgi:hypothetical protein